MEWSEVDLKKIDNDIKKIISDKKERRKLKISSCIKAAKLVQSKLREKKQMCTTNGIDI